MKKNLNSNISVQDIANIMQLTPEHLGRIFHKVMGISPHQYITRLKMEEAMFKLVNTNERMEQIADELGYSDAFHFSHVFTKFTGLSPAKYRQAGSPANPYQPVTKEFYFPKETA
jgi:AraC-like DNA-binding protein